MDDDQPKEKLISLILQSQHSTAGAEEVQARDASAKVGALRAELESLGLMALHKRAVGEGVDVMSDRKDAMKGPDPKAALAELLLALPR